MKKSIDDSKIHSGHRARMRHKLISHGQHIFDTYELLEMLLYYVIPYKDTNPISKNLLYAFGGLDGVFRASRSELLDVSGVGESVADLILRVGELVNIIGAEMSSCEDDFSDYEDVGRYLVNYFKGSEDKQVVALFLDSSMRLIDFKKLYDLEYDSGGVKAKRFIDEAVKSRAVVVISAHNHPFGPFFPTPGDRETNKIISESLGMAGFVHAEHYIVSGDRYAGIGSISNFTGKLSQMPVVSQFISAGKLHEGRLSVAGEQSDERCSDKERNREIHSEDSDYFASLIDLVTAGDGKNHAVTLLGKYKTIENVMTASVSEITDISGEKVAVFIKLLAYLTSRRKTDLLKIGSTYTSAEIGEYLKALYLGESVEKAYLIGFDSKGRLLGIKMLGEGTVSASEIMPRKALEAAIEMSAHSVSVSHNHPFGVTVASRDDLNVTQHFEALFASCEIGFKEHYIVAGQLCNTIEF